jgi:dihydropteroate synthase
MGVLNVTPDSFSDGGRWLDCDAAVRRGLELVAEGADVVDVGGESTRPGAEPVDEAEERRRVLPVVEALAPHVRVSVDTRKEGVAEAAVAAGATLVNDVSASLAGVAAARGVGWVAMHMQGEPRTMQAAPRYDDVVAEVRDFLVARAGAARDLGVDEVWVDPGIGFGKTAAHNLTLLRHLGELVATGFPVVVGTSRKGFLGALCGGAPPDDRLEGSLATAVHAVLAGAGMVRAHDVAATVQAVRVVAEPVAEGAVA